MAFIITEPCIGIKDASCVNVCPVDCIHTTDREEMFFINPPYCVTVCPVQAIFDEYTMPPTQRQFIQKNRAFFQK